MCIIIMFGVQLNSPSPIKLHKTQPLIGNKDMQPINTSYIGTYRLRLLLMMLLWGTESADCNKTSNFILSTRA